MERCPACHSQVAKADARAHRKWHTAVIDDAVKASRKSILDEVARGRRNARRGPRG